MTLAIAYKYTAQTRFNDQPHDQSNDVSDNNKTATDNVLNAKHKHHVLQRSTNDFSSELPEYLVNHSQTFLLANGCASADFHAGLEAIFKQNTPQSIPEYDFEFSPAATNLTLDDTYDFYSNTPEGKLILDRESAYHNPAQFKEPELRELFIARVKFNRGEGGIELFSEFMPNRTALLDNPAALTAYDEQYQLFLTEIQNESKIASTGLPLDPSLQVILASGLAEAFAQSPQRVNEILTDIDGGWTINYEFEHGGLYSYHQIPTKSATASLDFKLNTLLYSYAITNDEVNIFAHEAAHSLDAQGSVNLDGLPALSAQESLIFRFIRSELFKQYYESKSINPNNPDTFGLEEYAFKDIKEFWAEVSEYFLSGEKGARIILDISPELYDILSRYYKLEYELI